MQISIVWLPCKFWSYDYDANFDLMIMMQISIVWLWIKFWSYDCDVNFDHFITMQISIIYDSDAINNDGKTDDIYEANCDAYLHHKHSKNEQK